MSNLKWPSVLKRTGGNCPGGSVRVGYFSRRELSGGELLRGNCPGGRIYLEHLKVYAQKNVYTWLLYTSHHWKLCNSSCLYMPRTNVHTFDNSIENEIKLKISNILLLISSLG